VAAVVDPLARHLEAGGHAARHGGPLQHHDAVAGERGAPPGGEAGGARPEDGDRRAQVPGTGPPTGDAGSMDGQLVVASPT
jgi:hypothetical protein